MAESTAVAKQQDIDDSLSSDEWTIIEKKESKITEKEETLNEPKETVVPEDACQVNYNYLFESLIIYAYILSIKISVHEVL